MGERIGGRLTDLTTPRWTVGWDSAAMFSSLFSFFAAKGKSTCQESDCSKYWKALHATMWLGRRGLPADGPPSNAQLRASCLPAPVTPTPHLSKKMFGARSRHTQVCAVGGNVCGGHRRQQATRLGGIILSDRVGQPARSHTFHSTGNRCDVPAVEDAVTETRSERY